MSEYPNHFHNTQIVSVDTDPAVYHKEDYRRGDPKRTMSRSDLMNFVVNPRRWLDGYESKDTEATEFGSLVDCLALQPQFFAQLYAAHPETYTDSKTGEEKPWRWNAKPCEEWAAENEGKTTISPALEKQARWAVKNLNENPQISALLACSQKQVMMMAEYHDPVSGIMVPFKILLDLYPNPDSPFGKCNADLKSARNAAIANWETVIHERGYHVQAAVYLDVVNALPNEDRTDFAHVIVENVEPFAVGRRLVSSEFIEGGRNIYMAALQKYCQCLKTNQWPGYDDDTSYTQWNGWTIISPTKPWIVSSL